MICRSKNVRAGDKFRRIAPPTFIWDVGEIVTVREPSHIEDAYVVRSNGRIHWANLDRPGVWERA